MAIDEKKLIEDIEEYQEWIFNETIDWFKYEGVFASIYEIIKAQPKLSFENKTSDKWIPCSEDLPKEEGWYLVTVRGWFSEFVTISKFEDKAFFTYGKGVIAWRGKPLPAPYKGDE